METIYPVGPSEVPAAFTRPASSYQRHAWIAVGGLLLFMLLYFALTAWFILTGIEEFARLASGEGILPLIVGVCSLFLAFFMLKALFFIKKSVRPVGIEITRQEQPRLFAFLDRIADEAGAPRARKVFVTGRVNAAVFYDLSLLNLLFPSRKNLEIGLGLVNMLNLGEFKAVCAHEFGHFAQRSMAVGRWVYTAQQIAAHIVGKRDAMDTFLRRLSRSDFRIAWVGWLLGVVVWALRAVVDAVFRLVVIAQRALSREMEMQADLVAVSVSGSDALVHALHRLKVTDDAWDRTMNFLRGEVAAHKPPRDIFEVHQALADRLGVIYNDPSYSKRPTVPPNGAAAFRVFDGELAQPPRMWSTHPMNYERENNAKRVYLYAPMDERSAWLAFDDTEELRERMTRELSGQTTDAVIEPAETLKRLDNQFQREHLKPHYQGIYLGFSPVRQSASVADLHESVKITAPIELDALYPAALSENLDRLRSLEREHALLSSLRDRIYDAPDGVIRHRGRILKRSELPAAIALVDRERTTARSGLETALKRVRSLHLSAAARISPAWHDYLAGVLEVLHYADHAEANIRDAQAGLARTWQRATARGSIDERGVRLILASANDVQRALSQVFHHAASVQPGPRILTQLGVHDWMSTLGAFGLNAPSRSNINDWIRNIDKWINHAVARLSALRCAALDELLATESTIAAATRGAPPGDAPNAVLSVPRDFFTLVTGTERGQYEKLDFWQKFQTATGFLPGLARAVVALAIVGSVLAFGWIVGRTTVTVYNGLERTVVATVGGRRVALKPEAREDISIRGNGSVQISAQTDDGQPIETFDAPISASDTHLVYTIAAAAPLQQWTAAYGRATAPPPRLLAPNRWQSVYADDLFHKPPQRIQTHDGAGTRSVIETVDGMSPQSYIPDIHDEQAVTSMLLVHTRFDSPDSPYLLDWLWLASKAPGFDGALTARLAHFPNDIVALRAQQDTAVGSARESVCAHDRAAADASPAQPDLAYLAARCTPAGTERDQQFVDGNKRWPQSPWFANAAAAVAAEHADYQGALDNYLRVMHDSPALRTTVADQAFRLMRLIDPASAQQHQNQFASLSLNLRELLLFEPGAPVQPGPSRAFGLLSDGQLDEAVAAAGHTPTEAHVLRMAAASQGASDQLRAQAAALPASVGIDPETVWLALAEGANADDPAITKVLSEMDRGYDSPHAMEKMQRFLALCRQGDAAGAEQALDGVPFVLRAQAFAAGNYLLRGHIPETWRTFATRVLLGAERPYLG